MRVIALLALFVAADAAAPSNTQRIIGGSVATITQWPSMVSCLHSSNLVTYSQACGGTILNNRAVLTAAHCTFTHAPNRWRVRVGSTWANSGGSVYNLHSIINHHNYNDDTFDNDIAVLRITDSLFIFNNNVRPVSIAGTNYNVGDNQVVWATGWGMTSANFWSPSEQLRQVQVWTVNQAVCRQRYATRNWAITENMLCAGWLDVGGRGQCQGDSGGPLFHNGVQVGVCSFGLGCAQSFFPAVNARVSRYTTWIVNNA